MDKKKHQRISTMIHWIERTSYGSLFIIWCNFTIFFALLYFLFSTYAPGHGAIVLTAIENPWIRLANGLYYSIITATSTGYGDIVPEGFSKVFAAIQSTFSLFLFAAFVTKLISYRQEVTLHEVHKLTFDENFHNIREEFFLTRKDFDRVIVVAQQTHAIPDELWEDLVTAYQRIQGLFREIPTFYADDDNHYTIDALGEELLLAAVQRTFHRLNSMFNTLSREGIDWTAHEKGLVELRNLVQKAKDISPLWKEQSPHNQMEAFEEIITLNNSIHELIQNSLPSK
jgi:hypothetical protein